MIVQRQHNDEKRPFFVHELLRTFAHVKLEADLLSDAAARAAFLLGLPDNRLLMG